MIRIGKNHRTRAPMVALGAVLVLTSLGACSSKPADPVITQPGSFQGRVVEGTPLPVEETQPADAAVPSAAPRRQAAEPAPGAGLPGVNVCVLIDRGLRCDETSGDNTRTPAVDEAGHFSIDDLPSGVPLIVSMEKNGYATLKGSITIPAVAGDAEGGTIPIRNPVASVEISMIRTETPRTQEIDFNRLKFRASLMGIVTDGTAGAGSGTPLADVTVTLFFTGHLVTAQTRSDDPQTAAFDETGLFSVSNLPVGVPILVTFEKGGFLRNRGTVVIPPSDGSADPVSFLEVSMVQGDAGRTAELDLKPLPFSGTIQGIARDGTVGSDFGKPLTGVTVSALVLGRVVTTLSKSDDPLTPGFDETGFFALNNLPIGVQIPVRFSAADYVPVTSVIQITDPALSTQTEQETAQVTYDIDLVKSTASLLVIVYARDGPANGATVVLDLTNVSTPNLGNSTGTPFGSGFEVRSTGTTDANGQVKFEKLPPVLIPANVVVVQPFNEDGQGDPDYTTATHPASIDLRQLSAGAGPPTVRINLQTSNARAPEIVWSSVVNNRTIKSTDPIRFIFSLPMDTADGRSKVELLDATAVTAATPTTTSSGLPVPFKATWVSNVELKIDPVSDLQPTHQATALDDCTVVNIVTFCYQVRVQAQSDRGARMASAQTVRFRVSRDSAAATTPTPSLWNAPNATRPDWNATAVTIQWGNVGDAVGYNVYMKDNKINADWVRVDTTLPSFTAPHSSPITATFNFPAQLDNCQTAAGECAGIEALAYGGRVSIAVTALNADGIESEIDAQKALDVGDVNLSSTALLLSGNGGGLGVAQRIEAGQSGVSGGNTANNTGASVTADKRILVRLFGFPEPMGGAPARSVYVEQGQSGCTAGPTNDSGTTATKGFPQNATWTETTAGQGNRELFAVVTVEKGKSAAGDCIRFELNGVTDFAGNAEALPTDTANLPDPATTGTGSADYAQTTGAPTVAQNAVAGAFNDLLIVKLD